MDYPRTLALDQGRWKTSRLYTGLARKVESAKRDVDEYVPAQQKWSMGGDLNLDPVAISGIQRSKANCFQFAFPVIARVITRQLYVLLEGLSGPG